MRRGFNHPAGASAVSAQMRAGQSHRRCRGHDFGCHLEDEPLSASGGPLAIAHSARPYWEGVLCSKNEVRKTQISVSLVELMNRLSFLE